MRERKLRQADEDHRLLKEAIERDTDRFMEEQRVILQTCEEELETRKELLEKSMKQLTTYLKANFPEAEDNMEQEANLVPAAAAPATLSANILTEEAMAQHMAAEAQP